MNKHYRATVVYLLLLLFYACRKDKPADVTETPITIGARGVLVINEGNFQFGNAKISYYDPTLHAVKEDLFQAVNNYPLGDVCQSMYVHNGKAYLVLNNSGKIEVVDQHSFISKSSIHGFVSPRYFLPVSNSKAYVTDFKSNSITVVDLSNNAISGEIACHGWTEELVLAYGKVFVTNQKSNKVYVINTLTDGITDSITVGYGSNSIKEDRNGKLWVMCGGNSSSKIAAALYRINPIINEVEEYFTFTDENDSPWRLRINGTHDTLYYLNHGVCLMPITGTILPTPLIADGTSKFYGLGIDPSSGIIYVADAVDYVQRGVIYRYQPDGKLINQFFSGINPGDFYFN